jgi:hypothetical protein
VTASGASRYGRGVRRWLRWFPAALVALVVDAIARAAAAQAPPPAQRGQVHSQYERDTMAIVLGSLHETEEPHPEGKIIERVIVVPLDVFEPRDPPGLLWKPLPGILNSLHATTRPSIVERELLVREGAPYNQVLIDETIRNLRQLAPLSLVLVVPAKSDVPGRVDLVVITKDVWSLRLAWGVVGTPGGLEQLVLQPSELNVAGTHQTILGNFVYEPLAFTYGVGYMVPRIATSRVALVASANIMVNRASGSPEGSFGSLVAGEPLFSGVTPWAWDATTEWQDVIQRRYENAGLVNYLDPATGLTLPFEYRTRELGELLELRRAFGWDTRHELTFAASILRDVYQIPPSGASQQTIADFTRTYVPVSDTGVGPTVQYETYTKRYARLIDFDTLALQEDYRLGHDMLLNVGPRLRALGSTRDYVQLTASAQYTVAIRDGLFRVAVASITDVQSNKIPDAQLTPATHLATPTIAGLGRIVLDARLDYRWRNYLNAMDFVGGGTGLRGFPTSFFVGADSVTYSLEVRSRPVEILSCQLAGVAFFDAADASASLNALRPFQSTGIGLRALFPWLDRVVFRADLGVPLVRPIDPSTGRAIPPIGYIVSFGQAFDMPSVAPVPALPTEQVEVPTDPGSN